jgi:hypothetical protein
MILYDNTSLENLRVQEEAGSVYDAGMISEAELKQIKQAYPSIFYHPNLIIRSGFFILTCIGLVCSGSLITLIFEPTHIMEHAGWPVFLGLCCYAILEFFVRTNRHFHSGIDDAMLWCAAALLAGGIIWGLSDQAYGYLLISACILLFSGWFSLRFANTLMSSIAGLSALALVFFAWNHAGSIGEATMPFVIMLCSFLIYRLADRISKDPRALYYQKCLRFLEFTTLTSLYAAGNYFVVQKLCNMLHQLPAETNNPIPFSWIFWCWTILLPLVYVAQGIRKKNMLLLRLGLILIAAAAYTFRFYHQLLAIEYVLVIAGGLILILIIGILKYLKTPKLGFTYAQRSRKHWVTNLNLESLVVAGVSSHTQSVPVNTRDRFDGGSFGGAGASGEF